MKILLLLLAATVFAGCQHNVESEGVAEMHEFTQNTRVVDVINCKSFDGFGRLIFPTRGIDDGLTLKNLDGVLIWYTQVNPRKNDTGLFFFRGKPDAKFAICNAGGGFYYVGAMHDGIASWRRDLNEVSHARQKFDGLGGGARLHGIFSRRRSTSATRSSTLRKSTARPKILTTTRNLSARLSSLSAINSLSTRNSAFNSTGRARRQICPS